MSKPVEKNKAAQSRFPTRGLAGWKRLGPVMKKLADACGIQVSMEDADGMETVGGIHFKGRGGADGDAPTKPDIFYAAPAPALSTGDLLYLTLSPIGGAANLTFDWYRNDVILAKMITGTGEAACVVYSVTPADAGIYHCVISNSFGSETTDDVEIFVS